MKFFRSNVYHLLLGAIIAVSVFVCFITPIGGSFNDVVTLKMNNVSNITPVKATITAMQYDSAAKKFYLAKDPYGSEKRILIDKSYGLKIGDVLVAESSYWPSDDFY